MCNLEFTPQPQKAAGRSEEAETRASGEVSGQQGQWVGGKHHQPISQSGGGWSSAAANQQRWNDAEKCGNGGKNGGGGDIAEKLAGT